MQGRGPLSRLLPQLIDMGTPRHTGSFGNEGRDPVYPLEAEVEAGPARQRRKGVSTVDPVGKPLGSDGILARIERRGQADDHAVSVEPVVVRDPRRHAEKPTPARVHGHTVGHVLACPAQRSRQRCPERKARGRAAEVLPEQHGRASGRTQRPLAVVHAGEAASDRAYRVGVRSLGAGPGEEKARPGVVGGALAQALQVPGQVLVVAVEQYHELTVGGGEAVQHSFQLPLVRLPDHPDPVAIRVAGKHCHRFVRGAIVDNHQFVARRQLRERRVQRGAQEAGVVVVVDDHRDRWRSVCQHGQPQCSPSSSKRRQLWGR